jgi:hypothetical protein
MRPPLKPALTTLLLTLTLTLSAQELGLWRAASSTAKAITGDIALSSEKLTINFVGYTISRIRPLEKSEPAAVFDTESNPNGIGSLYRLSVPATTKLLHRNTLCGSETTQWMATYVSGKSLQIAFFSSPKPPLFTQEAIANSSDLCGTYSYVK